MGLEDGGSLRIGSILAACLVSWGAASAHADVTYEYTGKPFTTANTPFTTADAVTVTFTLTSALAANAVTDLETSPALVTSSFLMTAGGSSYSYSDGTAPGAALNALVSTDLSGAIVNWSFRLQPDVASFPATDSITSCNTAALLGDCGAMNIFDAIDLNPVNDGLENAFVLNDPGTWGVASPAPALRARSWAQASRPRPTAKIRLASESASTSRGRGS